MAINATVNASGIGNTRIYQPSGGSLSNTLGPGGSASVTSPVDIAVDPGGQATVVTSDGSSFGVGPNVTATLFQAGQEPALNAWDMFVKDTASGWTFRLSDLSTPLGIDSSVAAPNATDGLTFVAPDNTTQIVNVPPDQFTDVNVIWADSGTGIMQITQINITLQDASQWTWTLGSGWAIVFPPVV